MTRLKDPITRTSDDREPLCMVRVAYILSASHSGSTLLTMLLGAHPDVCTIGELKATNLEDPGRYRCSCGSLIRECPFWSKVRDGMAARGYDFDLAQAGTHFGNPPSAYARRLHRPLHRRAGLEWARDAALALSPAWRGYRRETQRRNLALMETVLELTEAEVIVDSSKIGLRLKYLLQNPELDVYVIRLIRDGRGVALTYVSPAEFADASDPSLRGGGMGGDRRSERLTMSQAAREWRRSNEEGAHALARVAPSRQTRVHYETLCGEPEATLRTLFEFLGVDPDRMVTDFRAAPQHVIGNGMRLDTTSEIRLDDRWRSVLSEEDLRTFEAVAGDLNRRLGYT